MKKNKKRAIFYIDGFNLYYGIKSTKKQYLKWLDLQGLSAELIPSNANLVAVKYFTARIKGDEFGAQRQQIYLNALSISEKLTITYGHFLAKERICRKCHNNYSVYEEKTHLYTILPIHCNYCVFAQISRFIP